MDDATFTIPDMNCGHCEKTLRAALAKAMPGAEVSIDLTAHRLSVAGNPELARKVIAEAGYTPQPA